MELSIFFIRDYNPEQNEDNVLARILDHKEAIISQGQPLFRVPYFAIVN